MRPFFLILKTFEVLEMCVDIGSSIKILILQKGTLELAHLMVWGGGLQGGKSTLKCRVRLKNSVFCKFATIFRPKIGMAATMILNVPKVNKYGGAHDQNVTNMVICKQTRLPLKYFLLCVLR